MLKSRDIVQSAIEEIKTDDIDSNLPDYFDDGLKQANEDVGFPDDTVSDYFDELE